ncbi:MAG: hypothetical protein U0T77_06315 [Chitinophagales bacterium]
MKYHHKLLLTILLLLSSPAFIIGIPNKPEFFMTYKIKGDSLAKGNAEVITISLFGMFDKQLKKEYPCIEFTTIHDVRVLVGFSKNQDLVGGPVEGEGMKHLSEAMGCDYLVMADILCYYSTGTLLITVSCFDVSNGTKMAMASVLTNVNGDWYEQLEPLAQKLVYGLKDYEICPYKGSVNIQVLTDTTDTKTEEYSVYCSKLDRKYKKQ